MSDAVTYLYCVVKTAARPRAGRAPKGLPGATPPAILQVGPSLWLVVADVSQDVYGPERLEAGLRDVAWVADVAMAHEGVVEHFARAKGSTVIPMKLFTMFSTRERAVADVRSRRGELDPVLTRLHGNEEWGIRVSAVASRQSAVASRQSPVGSRQSPVGRQQTGAGFLAAKKVARDRARDAVRVAADAAGQAFDRLAPIARETRQRHDAPAGTPPLLLDAVFLVPSTRRARFRTTARKAAAACAAAGAALTLSGPWPAYNFVQSPEEP